MINRTSTPPIPHYISGNRLPLEGKLREAVMRCLSQNKLALYRREKGQSGTPVPKIARGSEAARECCYNLFRRNSILLKKLGLPRVFFISAYQTVPVTVSTVTPGFTITAPVAASRVYVAAGTVICPATVAKSPVASL